MALTIASLPNKKFKAIVKSDGRIIKTKTFSKKSLARKWGRDLEQDQERISAYGLAGSSLTLKELHKEYVNYLYKDSGLKDIKGKIDRSGLILAKLGDKYLLDINPELIEGFLEHIHKTNSTRNRYKAELSAIFKYAIRKRYIKSNPVSGIINLKEPKGIVRFLSDSERGRLLNAANESSWDRLHLLINMALTTGARKGELLGLKWVDISLEEKTAYCSDTKNGESRVLPLSKSVIEELEEFESRKGLLFATANEPDKPFNFRNAWEKALDEARIEDFRFHDLRHDCASTLVMAGATLYETGQILGHKSVQTTARYSHLSTGHKAELINRVFN